MNFSWLRSKDMVETCSETGLLALRFDVVHADTLGLAPYVTFVPNAGTVLNHHDIESALVNEERENEAKYGLADILGT